MGSNNRATTGSRVRGKGDCGPQSNTDTDTDASAQAELIMP